MRVTAPSTCSWLDHSVSGLIRRTERPVQTRFRYASTYRLKLARQTKSLTHYTKGTPSRVHQIASQFEEPPSFMSSRCRGQPAASLRTGRPKRADASSRLRCCAPTTCRPPRRKNSAPRSHQASQGRPAVADRSARRRSASRSKTCARHVRQNKGFSNRFIKRLEEPAPTACRHPVSGTISLPLSGCFSPFPHGTGSLSVMHEYLGLEGGPPNFKQDFTCPALLEDHRRHYAYGAITQSRRAFQLVPLLLSMATGLVRVRSPLLTESRLMSFPSGT